MKLPSSLKKYFWNVDFSQLSPKTNSVLIAERILELGDIPAARWLLRNIDRSILKEVVKKRRSLSPRSRLFWASYFDIPLSQIPCLKKSSLQRRKTLWPY